jgi:hypothetical protein
MRASLQPGKQPPLDAQNAKCYSEFKFAVPPGRPAAKGKPMKMNNLFTAAYYYYYFTGCQR